MCTLAASPCELKANTGAALEENHYGLSSSKHNDWIQSANGGALALTPCMMQRTTSDSIRQPPSRRSRLGLNAANFFQAEAVGVVLPILNTFLKEAQLALRRDRSGDRAAGIRNVAISNTGRGSGRSVQESPPALLRCLYRRWLVLRSDSIRPPHSGLD